MQKNERPLLLVIDVPLPDTPLQRAIVHGNSHFYFATLSFKLAGRIEPALVHKLFDDLSRGKFGQVARAKALVNTSKGLYRFDCSFSKVDVVRFEKDIEESRLVVIGEKLDAAEIQKALQLVP